VAATKVKAAELGLTGRILIGEEGMNGTAEGKTPEIEAFMEWMREDERFAQIDFKRSEGTGNAFPKLVVKLRKEIVSSYLGEEDFNPVDGTAPYISAEALHDLIHSDEDYVIVDMRNDYEHSVGHFEGSVLPTMKHFRDLPKLLPELEPLKDKIVVTVCTGGIRCEKAAGFLVRNGFEDVQQLDGGIVTYMERYPNQDFKGKLYVFDGRVAMGFETDTPSHEVIGRCKHCGVACEKFVNDDGSAERNHFICCDECIMSYPGYVRAGVPA